MTDETLTILHKLVDEGLTIQISPLRDIYRLSLVPVRGRICTGYGNDIGEALDDALDRQDKVREERLS